MSRSYLPGQHRVSFLNVQLNIVIVVIALANPFAGLGAVVDSQTPIDQAAPPGEDLTIFTAQGGETGIGAGLFIMETESKEIIWQHTTYFRKYYDVDPINRDEVLFIAQVNRSKDSFRAIRLNWRTETVIAEFFVPPDTHDVDYIGGSSYVVADKHSSRVYEYNETDDDTEWEYRFADHFPHGAGDGIRSDYTHLNDVDLVLNGTAYLVSPREFDRVILINRTTKEIVWMLGQENDYRILHEQHNPVLLTTAPPTVLVADSENDRVVEYVRTNGEWTRIWVFQDREWSGWARDAERLPNGNTMIVGSGNHRLLEVSPAGEIVWSHDVSDYAHFPYDVERLRYGNDAGGPSMSEFPNRISVKADNERPVFDEFKELTDWLLPLWVNHRLILPAVAAPLFFLSIILFGIYRRQQREKA